MYSLENIARIVLTVALLLVAAIIHEVAHGYVAHLCGDDTAKEAGRLTLNPARHLDPFGSVVLPIIMAIAAASCSRTPSPFPTTPTDSRTGGATRCSWRSPGPLRTCSRPSWAPCASMGAWLS